MIFLLAYDLILLRVLHFVYFEQPTSEGGASPLCAGVIDAFFCFSSLCFASVQLRWIFDSLLKPQRVKGVHKK